MKIFALSLALIASLFASIASAEPIVDIDGRWGSQWRLKGAGNLEFIVSNAAGVSEVEVNAMSWQREISGKCKYISRLDDANATTTVHSVSSSGDCPDITGWTVSRADAGNLEIVLDEDHFRLKDVGLDAITLMGASYAVLPSQADKQTPQTDVLGITLGLTPQELASAMAEKGFVERGQKSWVREPYKDKYGTDKFRDTISVTFSEVVPDFDYYGAGTVKSLHRLNTPATEDTMHVEAMLALVKKKYGAPTVDSASSYMWGYEHGNINQAFTGSSECSGESDRSNLRACSHQLSMRYRVDHESLVTSIVTIMTDNDTERHQVWAQSLAALTDRLESQIAVFDTDNTLEF